MIADFFTVQSAFCVFALAWVIYYAVLRFQEHRLIKRLGGYAPSFDGWLPFNLDLVFQSVYLSRKCRDLDFWHYLFRSSSPAVSSPISPTAEFWIVGQRFIFTADPENIKAVLATQFDDYGKGENFQRDWQDFLGHGIFATDGEEWAASRQLLRPQFVKTRVRDLDIFEKHVQQLLSFLDGQGKEVDISELFYGYDTTRVDQKKGNKFAHQFSRYALDAATEYLFGRSVDSIGNADSPFAHAFNEVQRIQNMRARLGPLQVFVPRKEFWKGLKVMDSFIEPFIQDALRYTPGELDEKEAKSKGEGTWLQSVARFTRDRNGKCFSGSPSR